MGDKRTDKRTETHACDCISRQAAIDALKDVICELGGEKEGNGERGVHEDEEGD